MAKSLPRGLRRARVFAHQNGTNGGEHFVGFAGAMAIAIGLDALLGWPNWLVERIGHPVTWLGSLIGALDTRWNRAIDASWLRRIAGIAAALLVVSLAAGFGWVVQSVMISAWSRVVAIGILAMPF